MTGIETLKRLARDRRAGRRLLWAIPLALFAIGWIVTWPPSTPQPQAVRADWHPTEAWLYDRNGRLLESERVDYSRRRLAWVPLDEISPALKEAVIAAEDKRFH